MTPTATAAASTAAARRDAAQRTGAVPGRPAAAPDRRPPLRVVSDRPRPTVRRRRVAAIFSLALIVASLLSVIVGHAMLAEGQVRLSAVQSALSAEQTVHRQDILSVAGLETPARIVQQAHEQGMAPPTQIKQLPHVSLSTPLPAPKVAAATPATPSATSATAGTTSGQ